MIINLKKLKVELYKELVIPFQEDTNHIYGRRFLIMYNKESIDRALNRLEIK